ncbi:hypothetical protein RJ53_10240 [Methanocalculus chunghsingensis]|uniref:Uncharacterized protein n=1 Tax=Methanocalculus chunghsingensis TaxID=156457 RepID=A0A8J8B4X2_9EURY|nr:hypothetical protein [Methanocalculus chunghsingensis]MBR1369835.1 hypothetical protein [Methanocalculus chunghsingensis]
MTDDEKKEQEITPDPLQTYKEETPDEVAHEEVTHEEKTHEVETHEIETPPPQPVHEKETIHEIRYVEPPEEKKNGKLKIIAVIVLIILLLVVAAFATLNVSIYAPVSGATYPYTTTYNVWFPLGKTVEVGGMNMVALSTADEMLISVDGVTEKIDVGENKLISEKRAVVRTLGQTVVDTNFQIYLNYRGLTDQRTANFFLSMRTSQQVPEPILKLLIPRDIQAVPA